jgi:hypothetical protein
MPSLYINAREALERVDSVVCSKAMSEAASFAELTRALANDPEYRQALTKQLAARSVDEETLRQLIAYARGRQSTLGQAMARRVLTDAGVSWEAV